MEYTRKTGDVVETYIGTPKEIAELIDVQNGVQEIDEINIDSIVNGLKNAVRLGATNN